MDMTIVLSEEEVLAMCVVKALEVVSFRVPEGKQFEASFVRSYSGDVKVRLIDISDAAASDNAAASVTE